MRVRRVAAATTLTVVAGVPLLVTGATSAADEADAPLGGYEARVSAIPLGVRAYEPQLPVPDSPQGELDLSFTQAITSTGPTQRATASTVWPGVTVGDGMAVITDSMGLGAHDYPVKADANYPGGQPEKEATFGASRMSAKVDELTATATAVGLPGPPTDALRAAEVSSTSTVTRTEESITGTATAAASDVVIGGLIRVRNVEAQTRTVSTATAATAEGRVVATGVSVAGVELVVDDRGVHAAGQGGGLPGLPSDPNELLAHLGVTISGQRVVRSVQGALATYEASALQIVIDTATYKAALEPTGYRQHYRTLQSQLMSYFPQQFRDEVLSHITPYLFSFEDLAPKLVFDVGLVRARTSASPEYVIDLPTDLPTSGEVPVDPAPFEPGDGGSGAPPLSGPVLPPAPGTNGGTNRRPVAFTGELPEPFGGIPPALAVLAVLGAGVGGLVLRRWALAAGLLPGATDGCVLGAECGVPDLREEGR